MPRVALVLAAGLTLGFLALTGKPTLHASEAPREPLKASIKKGLESLKGAEQPAGNAALFAEEMAAAKKAESREGQVQHLRRALSLRPNDPQNIVIEYRIGIELSQRTPQRIDEGRAVFEQIVAAYKHMDYYSPNPVDRSESPQLMIPQAAVFAASYNGARDGGAKAREYAVLAMKALRETHKRRVADWQAPRKREKPDAFDGPIEASKRKSREHFYAKRRADAARGDVFGPLEMQAVERAVDQYEYSRSPQSPAEVAAAMAEIVKMFPATPMAEVAQQRAERAVAKPIR
jgi:hypothetical protein